MEKPRPAVHCNPSDRVQLRLSAELTHRLRQLAQRQGVTLYVTLLSGWAALLGRWCGQEEVVIGARAGSRRSVEIEPLIDVSENTAALLVRLQEDATVEELLRQVSATVAAAYAHENTRFEQSVEELKSARNSGSAFHVLLGLNDRPATITASTELQLPGLKLSEASGGNANLQLELSPALSEGEEDLTGTLVYASDLFDREMIERMAACWKVLLDGMVTDAQQPISRLPMLTAAEREQVLSGFNDTNQAFPQDRLIHELFEEQVERTPDSIALVYEQKLLTFAELNRRANQLARYLRQRGVGPDQLVAVCVERSLEMVVGMLGVLKAGGAYVPLDPAYPAERLAYMIDDAAPRILLTQERLRSTLPVAAGEAITIDGDWNAIAEHDDTNLDRKSVV